MSTRLSHRAEVVPGRPQPTASVNTRITLDGDFGSPPAGVPLFYVESPSHPGWYIGFDWSGVPRGTVKLANPIGSRLIQAPDGSAFAYAPNGKGGYDEFLDRVGRPIGGDPPHTYQDQMWAADSQHLCTLDYSPNYQVLAFSSDNSAVLVSTTPWASGIKTHLAVIKVATGKAVWRYDGDQELSGVFTEPTGAAFAIMLQSPSEQGLHPTVQLTMAFVDGIAGGIPGQFVRP